MANSSVAQVVNNLQEAQDTQKVEICALGHPLGNCPARRAGCNNHYQLLHMMMPPLQVVYHLRQTMMGDPAVKKWLDTLDSVLPGQRPTREGWR